MKKKKYFFLECDIFENIIFYDGNKSVICRFKPPKYANERETERDNWIRTNNLSHVRTFAYIAFIFNILTGHVHKIKKTYITRSLVEKLISRDTQRKLYTRHISFWFNHICHIADNCQLVFTNDCTKRILFSSFLFEIKPKKNNNIAESNVFSNNNRRSIVIGNRWQTKWLH